MFFKTQRGFLAWILHDSVSCGQDSITSWRKVIHCVYCSQYWLWFVHPSHSHRPPPSFYASFFVFHQHCVYIICLTPWFGFHLCVYVLVFCLNASVLLWTRMCRCPNTLPCFIFKANLWALQNPKCPQWDLLVRSNVPLCGDLCWEQWSITLKIQWCGNLKLVILQFVWWSGSFKYDKCAVT